MDPPLSCRNAEANHFSVSEVSELRKFDSLAVSGRQESVNSNFSFFSDNNLTEKDDLEDFDEHWSLHREDVTQLERSVSTERSFHAQISDAHDGSSHLIEELLESHLDEEEPKSSFISTVESIVLEDGSEEDNNFLGNLKNEILEGSKRDSEDGRSNSKLSWDNLVLKREIKIEFQESNEVKESGESNSIWSEGFESLFEEGKIALTEENLSNFFPAANIFLGPDDSCGLVSPGKSTVKLAREDPFKGEDKVGGMFDICDVSITAHYV